MQLLPGSLGVPEVMSKKGTGFEQPLAAHPHWHIDVSYINITGTFYYLCNILDGCSRHIVNWDFVRRPSSDNAERIAEPHSIPRARSIRPFAETEARKCSGNDVAG